MKLQVLVLEYWMTPDFRELFEEDVGADYPVIDSPVPVHLPDGIYHLRDTGACWFVTEGVPRQYKLDSFKYQLELLNAENLMPEQVAGLKAICKTRLATKSQRALLRAHLNGLEQRAVYRESRKAHIRSV